MKPVLLATVMFSLKDLRLGILARAMVVLTPVVGLVFLPMAKAQDSCPQPNQVTIEYKVAHAALGKCLFEEFRNDDLPRIHVYHHIKARVQDQYSYTFSGTNGCYYDWAYQGTSTYDHTEPGPYSQYTAYNLDITVHQLSDLWCGYTNWFTGSGQYTNYLNDARTNHTISFVPNCTSESTSTALERRDAWKNTPTLLDQGSGPTWYWHYNESSVGSQFIERGDCSFFEAWHNATWDTSTSSDGTTPINDDSLWGAGTVLSPTLKQDVYLVTNAIAFEVCSTPPHDQGQVTEYITTTIWTAELENEYTDGELYTNILSVMPAYPSEWYAPDSSSFYFLKTCAYSIIHKTHTTGPFDGWSFYEQGAELQKMKFRLHISGAELQNRYRVDWDVITYNFSTGNWTRESTNTTLWGLGDLYTGEFEVAPPYWDQSLGHGFVFKWVENIRLTVIPRFKPNSPPGTGPFEVLSGSGGCGGCGGQSSSMNGAKDGGIFVQFSMGQASNGISAESLKINTDVPSLSLATPYGLTYVAYDSSVEVIQTNGQIRQVKAPQALADIVVLDSFSYEIRYYLPSQVGSLVANLYQVSGNPFVTWKIENPDASTNTFNRLRVTETRGSTSKTYDFTYIAAAKSWKLLYPGNLREDEWSYSSLTNGQTVYVGGPGGGGNIPVSVRSVTNTIRMAGGADAYKVKRVYQQFGWGEGLVEETISPDSNPQTTTYAYYDYTYSGPPFKPLKLVVHPDGSWKYYKYNEGGTIAQINSSLGDLAAPTSEPNLTIGRCVQYFYSPVTTADGGTNSIRTPREVREYQAGEMIAQSYTVFLPGERKDIRLQTQWAQWDDSANLVTTTKYYTNGSNAERVQSIEQPDGTMALYEYVLATAGYQTNTVYSGQPNSGKTSIVNGTKEVTILGPFGEMISRTVTDVASGITLTADTYGNYDAFSRPTRVTHLDGTYEDTQYACCGVDTTTDRDGVVTFYNYDAMKRQTGTTRQGITMTNVLDAAGRTVKSIRIGTDATQIVLGQSRYNLAGELTYETNALNGVTSFVESVDGSGHKVRTTTNPDGGTRIETYYLDGSLMSVTGTAEYPVYYEYGVEYDYTDYAYRSYTKEIKGSPTGNEWTKTFTDMLGRTYKTEYSAASDTPASYTYYNNKGQMTNQIDPDEVSTLYQYNAKGELDYTAVDVNRNGVIDFSGTDRISYSTNDVYYNGVTNVRRTRSYVWKTDNANTSTLVSTMESSADGLRSWSTAWNNGQAITSQSRTVFAGSGYRYTTNIAPDNSYSVSISRYGTNVSATRFDSTGAQLSSVSFAYDSHGRQNRTTDVRNGTTTNWFNAADQVSATSTPTPATGQSAQVTTNYFDTSLRVWKTTLPDNTSVTNEFLLTGMLKKTYGSRTYPVEYTYDYGGRMATMKTWQNFANNSGAAITTWYYDAYRGWLTNKLYADNTGPSYGYTPAGRMETRTWARAVGGDPLVTTYSYNDAGDMDGVDYSDSTPDVTYTYNRLGQQKTIVHDGTTTTFAYNDAGLVLTESYSGGTLNGLSVTNGYDQYLRRTNLSALNGSTVLARTAYGYDTASRLKTVADGVNTAAYGYLANSPLVGNVWFTNNTTLRMTTSKSYDYLNRLTAISSATGGSNVAVFNYANNTANQRTSITNVDSSRWVYQYDALGQVVSGKKYWSDGTPVAGQQFEYGFDDIGNRKTTAVGGDNLGANLRYASYTANSLNQYTSRDVSGFVNVIGSASNSATVTLWGDNGAFSATARKGEYFRGELGVTNTVNPVWLTITNLAVLNNGSNPDLVTNTIGKTFVAKTPETYGYDLDGNLTNDGRWVYTWDAENRLVQQESLSGAPTASKYKLEFAYDSKGRRIQKLVSTNNGSAYVAQYTNRFVYDGWNLAAILNPQSSILQSFAWGLDLSGSEQGAGGVGGLLLCRDATTATTNYVAYDGNGNVAAFVNATNGAVTAQYEYGPFGEVLRTTGASAKANPFRFSTKYQDDESDYLYYGYRSYNPSTGRWLSRDPIGEKGGKNVYGFVANTPTVFVDRLGLDRCCSCFIWTLLRENKDRELLDLIDERMIKLQSADIRSGARVRSDVMTLGKRGGKLGFALFARFLCKSDVTLQVENDPEGRGGVSWNPTTGIVNLNAAFLQYERFNEPDAEFLGTFKEVGTAIIAHEFSHAFIGLRDPFNVYVAENSVRKALRVPKRARYAREQLDHPAETADGNGLVWAADNEFGAPWVVTASSWYDEYRISLNKTMAFIKEWGAEGCDLFP